MQRIQFRVTEKFLRKWLVKTLRSIGVRGKKWTRVFGPGSHVLYFRRKRQQKNVYGEDHRWLRFEVGLKEKQVHMEVAIDLTPYGDWEDTYDDGGYDQGGPLNKRRSLFVTVNRLDRDQRDLKGALDLVCLLAEIRDPTKLEVTMLEIYADIPVSFLVVLAMVMYRFQVEVNYSPEKGYTSVAFYSRSSSKDGCGAEGKGKRNRRKKVKKGQFYDKAKEVKKKGLEHVPPGSTLELLLSMGQPVTRVERNLIENEIWSFVHGGPGSRTKGKKRVLAEDLTRMLEARDGRYGDLYRCYRVFRPRDERRKAVRKLQEAVWEERQGPLNYIVDFLREKKERLKKRGEKLLEKAAASKRNGRRKKGRRLKEKGEKLIKRAERCEMDLYYKEEKEHTHVWSRAARRELRRFLEPLLRGKKGVE